MRCPICKAEANWFCERKLDSTYRCQSSSCRHLFAYPQPNDKQLKKFYAEDYYKGGDATHYTQTHHSISRQILEWLPSIRRSFLDVGCGEGHLFHALSSASKKYYVGVETDKEAREKAQQSTGCIIANSLPALADFGKCFEVVIINQVIEHFRDPIASLRMIESVSSEKAILFVATANSGSLKARIWKCNWEQLQNRTHLHLFTEASLILALQKGGWADTVLIGSPLRYPHHGILRWLFHRVLRKLKLDGNLTLLANRS